MITTIKTGVILLCSGIGLAACTASNPPTLSEGHLKAPAQDIAAIPEPVQQSASLPQPVQRPALETYTVIVNQVPVSELLFSIARDAKLNLDIDQDIQGKVTMNAIDQTLPRLLERITSQVPINYDIKQEVLHIRADNPYIEMYDIAYLNMSRNSTGNVTVSTAIDSTGSSTGGSSGGNDSSSLVTNTSNNEFWKTLTINIAAIIGEAVENSEGKTSVETTTNIIVNRESGVMAVKATSRQHEQIQGFFDKVMNSAKRQVLIEATIAEVTLSDRYQAGIDWSLVSSDPNTTLSQNLLGGNLGQTPFFSWTLSDSIGDNPLNATLKALETFGDVKVLSSPKVMALNNQTSILKVVDNQVYFSIDVTPQIVSATGAITSPPTFETEINTVPVGFVMTVTPQIDKNDVVTMNVRPTISRIVDEVADPNPELANAGVISLVPVIQVREIESVLKVNNGDTAVIGGLMQDQINKKSTGIPILSSIPLLGALFSYTDDEYVKSELVIFIRPVVAHDASLTGDLSEYSKYLTVDNQ